MIPKNLSYLSYLPEGLEVLYLDDLSFPSGQQQHLPQGLKELYLNKGIHDDLHSLPEGLQVLYINGNYTIIVTDKSGKKTIYKTNKNNNTYSSNTLTSYNSLDTQNNFYKNMIFYGPNGGSAQIIKLNNTYLIQITYPNGNVKTFTNSTNNDDSYFKPYYPNEGNPDTIYSEYNEEKSYNNPNEMYNYSDSLPPGIPSKLIPPGQEDLYILKSEVVPPVCPAPISAIITKTDSCPPCPACARCPEPSFECKKVPNYDVINEEVPTALITPYSTFGS
jgi:hypothetical protein